MYTVYGVASDGHVILNLFRGTYVECLKACALYGWTYWKGKEYDLDVMRVIA